MTTFVICAFLTTLLCFAKSLKNSEIVACFEKFNETIRGPEEVFREDTPSRDTKCVVACFAEELKIVENGTLNLEKTKNMFGYMPGKHDEAKAELCEGLDDCYSKRAETENDDENCESLFEFMKCTFFVVVKVEEKYFGKTKDGNSYDDTEV